MSVSSGSAGNPSEQSYAGMVPPRTADGQRSRLIHAWALMAQQRWDDVLDDLDRPPRLGSAGRMAQRTARNMRALQQHRPAVYRQLLTLFPVEMNSRHYRPVRAKAGWKTIVVRTIEGDRLINPIDDPSAAAQRDVAKLAGPMGQDIPFVLCSISDGYFFEALTREPREHGGGRVTGMYLIEPEPDLLLANLAMHDFSGKRGPIAGRWVEWFVGPDWRDQFVERFEAQWMLPVPGLVLGRKDMHEPLQSALSLVKDFRKQSAGRQRESALRHGVYTRREELAGHLRGEGGRKPRVLVIGSRFDGPLGDAGDRAVAGFEQLGWECHHLLEAQPHHRMTPLPVWRALGDTKPDLVVTLGERWADRRDVIDPRVPVVRWLIGEDPHAASPAQRASLNLRDFVLSPSSPLADARQGYPARQVLFMPGVVEIAGGLGHTAAADPDGAGADMVYLGQGGADPRDLLAEVAGRLPNAPLRRLAQAVGEQMLADDAQGRCYATAWEINQLARRLAPQIQGLKLSDKLYRQFAGAMFSPFNEALYCQQALAWAVEAAEALGLTLAIHGQGWKANPRFAAYARARPSTAKRRDALIAQSKVNLHIAPSFSLDTKLMDGLAAGGFYLIRRHPADALLPEIVGFLENHCSRPAQTAEQAYHAAPKKHLPRLERLLEQARWITDQSGGLDPIACVRACMHGGLLDKHRVALPRLDMLQFDDGPQLRQRLERFVNAPDQRLDVVKKQRASIQHRLSYSSGLTRIVQRIAELVETEEAS